LKIFIKLFIINKTNPFVVPNIAQTGSVLAAMTGALQGVWLGARLGTLLGTLLGTMLVALLYSYWARGAC
jgi:hypothetical protein